MATKLKKLEITKVDLCKAGADPDAHIEIFKSVDPDDIVTITKRDIPASHRHQMPRGAFAGPHESFPIEKPEDVAAAAHLVGHASDPEAVKARIIAIARRKGPSFVARLPQSWVTKSSEETQMSKKFAKIDFATATPEQVVAYAKSLEAEVEQLEKKAPPSNDDDEDDADPAPPKKVKKAKPEVSEEVQKALDAANEEIAKTKKDNETLREEIAKEREARQLSDIAKSVERDMPKVPGTVQEIAKALHEAKTKLTPESYGVIEKAFKAGSAAIEKAEKEVGSSTPTVGTALDEINKAAEELMAKDAKLSKADAITAVAKSNADLYRRYKDEQGRR